MFRFLPPIRCLWLEPAGGEQKSTVVEQKTVTLIYPYPKTSDLNEEVNRTEPFPQVAFPVFSIMVFISIQKINETEEFRKCKQSNTEN
jgi:hypothetical protein